MDDDFTDEELAAFLAESLPDAQMSAIEDRLRASEPLRLRLARIARGQDSGVHSVGEIWRRERLSCPSRAELGEFLLGTLPDDHAAYIEFHITVVGCRFCAANRDDLLAASEAISDRQPPHRRRSQIFQSTIGSLRRGSGD